MSASSSSFSSSSSNQLVNDKSAKITIEVANFTHSYATNKKFTLPSNEQIEFSLNVCPNFNFPFFGRFYTMIYLTLRNSNNKNQHAIRYRISILNSNGDLCMTQERIKNFSLSGNVYGLYKIDHSYLIDPTNGLLANGKLTVYCETEEIDSKKLNFSRNDFSPKLPCNPTLENYLSLLESGKFSDVTLIIGEKKLLAHKNILSAQSKVFAAMFENDCEEKRQNRVEITDVPIEVCEQMLRYIYTGNIPELSCDCTGELFVAADKYQLDYLKVACEQSLSSLIDVESVTSTLLVADMHSATLLKSKCIEYIVEHAQDVIKTEGWKHLAKTRADLAVQLFESIANKK